VQRFSKSQIAGYMASLATVGAITAIFYRGPFAAATTTVVLTFLLSVLVFSAVWGIWVSVFMSLTSVTALAYFFFPPYGHFAIDNPQDWVALIAFLLTAVIGSDLSARATRQAHEASRQRNEVNQLYEFSQRLLGARNPHEFLNEIPAQIVEIFQVRTAALYLSEQNSIHRSNNDSTQVEGERLKAVQAAGNIEIDTERGLCFSPLRLGSQIIGSIGITGSAFSGRTLEALATLIAMAIDRGQAIELLGKAAAARESELLKSALLDAIAHDFKTPLTSIKAAATSLIDDLSYNKRQRGDLLMVIEEEADRINQLIGQAIEMAQLDAGKAKLQCSPHLASELIGAALKDCEAIQKARPIHTMIQDKDARVHCDLFWAKKVLVHLIRNADLYSLPKKAIGISTEQKNDCVFFHVKDEGHGIEKSEIGQVFDKFFRGKNQRHRILGTGMGLAIAKAVVEAHGGTINVVSEVGSGSVFTFSLPTEPMASSVISVTPPAESRLSLG
jgi:two-component system sensor histidine kinase KdpD